MRNLLFTALFAFTSPALAADGTPANESCPPISMEQAKAIATEAMNIDNAGAYLDDLQDGLAPGFYSFEIQNTSSDPDSHPHIESLSVNQITGDIWHSDAMCWQITSKSIRKLQAEIRKGCALPDRKYQRLRNLRPSCFVD